MNFQMFKLDLEKAEEPEIKLPTSFGSWKKQESPRKHLVLLFWLHQTFDCVYHNKLWKILIWSAPWEICMQVKKQQLEPDMEQWTGSKSGKERLYIVSLLI